jgi:hypothetical protein
MMSKEIAINPRDGFDLLTVWEKDGRKWYLLQLARPQSAIAPGKSSYEIGISNIY